MSGSTEADSRAGAAAAPLSGMPAYFRAVALDYDGTIAFGRPPEACVLAALLQVREERAYSARAADAFSHAVVDLSELRYPQSEDAPP